jgi:hypothetical protein
MRSASLYQQKLCRLKLYSLVQRLNFRIGLLGIAWPASICKSDGTNTGVTSNVLKEGTIQPKSYHIRSFAHVGAYSIYNTYTILGTWTQLWISA